MNEVPRLSVDIVSDVMCPWCIIGWLKFRKVMAHFEGRLAFRVQWHPFELNPDMPPEGEDSVEHVIRKYGITPDQSRANRDRLAGIAADLDFSFNRGPGFRMRNSFDAHRLLHWAGEHGKQKELKKALFDAYFTKGQDPSSRTLLVQVAGKVGLDEAEAVQVLSSGRYAQEVRDMEHFYHRNGIQSVPAVIIDENT